MRWIISSPCFLTPSLPIQLWLLSGMNCQADPEALVQPCALLSISVLQYGAGQAVCSPAVNKQKAWLHPCSTENTAPHISPFPSTEVSREKTIFCWKVHNQTRALNPELALQCLSDPAEEFKADCIFCVCACYLTFEVLWVASICLQLTCTKPDCKSLFKKAIGRFFLAPIQQVKPAKFWLHST